MTAGRTVPLPDDDADLAAGYIARWRPSSVSPQAASFARDVIGQVAPEGKERAKNLLWAAARLAGYAVPLGLDPAPEVLLHPSVIERFAATAPGLAGVARRTLRTNLRFLARRVVPQLAPADTPLPREHAKAPYSPAEIAGYLALAGAQPTPARRMRGAGLPWLGPSRRRPPWPADVADLLGLATFMHAAGITCSQRLGDLLAGLEPAAEKDAGRLLGGGRPWSRCPPWRASSTAS